MQIDTMLQNGYNSQTSITLITRDYRHFFQFSSYKSYKYFFVVKLVLSFKAKLGFWHSSFQSLNVFLFARFKIYDKVNAKQSFLLQSMSVYCLQT